MIWMCAAKAASPFIGKDLKGESDRVGCAIIGQHRCIEMVSANEMGQLPINAVTDEGFSSRSHRFVSSLETVRLFFPPVVPFHCRDGAMRFLKLNKRNGYPPS
jgi:hypothetical protein